MEKCLQSYFKWRLRILRIWNLCFMAKLGWKIFTDHSKLWGLCARYLRNSAFLDCIPDAAQSPLWRDILKGRKILHNGLIVGIGNGKDTSLWYHHWVGNKPPYLSLNSDVPNSMAHWTVSHIIRNGEWYTERIARFLSPALIDNIKSIPISNSETTEDFICWPHSKTGAFTVKSAYIISSPCHNFRQ